MGSVKRSLNSSSIDSQPGAVLPTISPQRRQLPPSMEGKPWFSNKEIAESLHKSVGTIKNQVSAILAKLQARDRTQAVLKAIVAGILS